MLETPSIFAPDHTICYGFYDAGPGLGGLTDQDQSYAYFTGSYADWMGDLAAADPHAANLPFNRFALPGAHDAGMNTMNTARSLLDSAQAEALLAAITLVFPPLGVIGAVLAPHAIQNLAITQKDSITDMLNVGIRYFDFRPGYLYSALRDFSGALFHQHKFIPGMAYAQFLEEVLIWLNAHPFEVVVVNCETSGFEDVSMAPDAAQLAAALDAARAATGITSAMIADGTKSALEQSIAELRAANCRLIFLDPVAETIGKYDSYSQAAYATLTPAPIVAALARMANPPPDGTTYTVLQLQGTPTFLPAVAIGAVATTSDSSSPLMSVKANFDRATLGWASSGAAALSCDNLLVLLNDFADNAMVSTCIGITRRRMGL
ncbi:MAG: hypothetical protein WDN44_12970 [Sphingomonas sp.]